jgi:hypothetical protein
MKADEVSPTFILAVSLYDTSMKAVVVSPTLTFEVSV